MKNIKSISLLIYIGYTLFACQSKEEKPLVNPPLPELNIAYTTYEVSAENGGVLQHPSGTNITIPANILVDSIGNPIEGNVTIRYREFHNAVDIFLSGIPMTYTEPTPQEADIFDVFGKEEPKEEKVFQTAGMFDIRAEQDRKAVFIKAGENIEVNMASYVKEDDYQFYALNEETKGWEEAAKPTVTPNQEKVEKLAAIEAQKPKRFPYNPKTHFIFNVNAFQDIAMRKTGKSLSENHLNSKTKAYGFSYYNASAFLKAKRKEEAHWWGTVNYEGLKHLPSFMVWKLAQGAKPLPKWINHKSGSYKKEERHYDNNAWLTYLGNNRYGAKITLVCRTFKIEPKRYKFPVKGDTLWQKQFYTEIEPVMPLNLLLQKPAKIWEENYEQTLAAIEDEARQAGEMAEVYRMTEISGFGIYNHDRFLENANRIQLAASFDFGIPVDEGSTAYDKLQVSFIGADNRSIVNYPRRDWDELKIAKEDGAMLFAILPGKRLVIMPTKQFAAIDFDKLKKMEKPSYKFKLQDTGMTIKTIEDLKAGLSITTDSLAM